MTRHPRAAAWALAVASGVLLGGCRTLRPRSPAVESGRSPAPEAAAEPGTAAGREAGALGEPSPAVAAIIDSIRAAVRDSIAAARQDSLAAAARRDSIAAAQARQDSLAAAARRDSIAAAQARRDSLAARARRDSLAAAGARRDSIQAEQARRDSVAAARSGALSDDEELAELKALGPAYIPNDQGPQTLWDTETQARLTRILLPVLRSEKLPARTRTIFWVLVTREGEVEDLVLQTPSGNTAFDSAARAFAETLTFIPAIRSNRPVPAWVLREISLVMR